ncbi:MAG: putative RDD family membrane protein YckC, partial [Arcticibacterium sp.]
MQVSIQTTQNVLIEQDKAGVGSRILAFLVDIVIITAYSYAMSLLL